MKQRTVAFEPGKSFFLFGPRGTGKSTWLRSQLKPEILIDLLESGTYTRLLARPESLGEFIPKDVKGVVAIDEVQRVPALLHEVHSLIESRRLVFALTGSSARGLRRAGVNLLAGRALTCQMFPLSAHELGADFDLSRSLSQGHLPALLTEPDARRYLESYVQTYLREEVLQEGLVRNLGAFARFLEAASFSHGATLNVAAVARECMVERKTVQAWFGVLEDLLLARRLPTFARRAQRAVASHPKFYFFDVGVYRALRPRGPLDQPAEIAGAALEGLVHQELLAANEHHRLGYGLFYWRTRGGAEVDFVLYGERGLVAIEVKHSARVRGSDLRGLRTFCADYPMARSLLINLGDRREEHDGVEVWPAGELLPRLGQVLKAGGREVV